MHPTHVLRALLALSVVLVACGDDGGGTVSRFDGDDLGDTTPTDVTNPDGSDASIEPDGADTIPDAVNDTANDAEPDLGRDVELGDLPASYAPFVDITLLGIPLYVAGDAEMPDIVGVRLGATDGGARLEWFDEDESPIGQAVDLTLDGDTLVASAVTLFGVDGLDVEVGIDIDGIDTDGGGGTPELSISVPGTYVEPPAGFVEMVDGWREDFDKDDARARQARLDIANRFRQLQMDPTKSGVEWFADTVQYAFDRYADAAFRAGYAGGQDEPIRRIILEDLVDVFVLNSYAGLKSWLCVWYDPELAGDEVISSEPNRAPGQREMSAPIQEGIGLTGFKPELQVGEGRYRHFTMNALARAMDPTLGLATNFAARLNGSDWFDATGDSASDLATNEIGREFYEFIDGKTLDELGDGRTVSDWIIDKMAEGGVRPTRHTVSVETVGEGVVTDNWGHIRCGAACTRQYSSVWNIELVAEPARGWVFTGWEEDCSGTDPCRIDASADRRARAVFEREANLSVLKTGTGDGTVRILPDELDVNVCPPGCVTIGVGGLAGDPWVLSAEPDEFSTFVGWSGGGCSGAADCTVPFDDVVDVEAEFARDGFYAALTVLTDPEGMQALAPSVDRPWGFRDGFKGPACWDVVVAGTNGTLVVDACTGEVVADWSFESTREDLAYYDAIYLPPPAGEVGYATLIQVGTEGFTRNFDLDGSFFRFGQFAFGPFYDAVAFGLPEQPMAAVFSGGFGASLYRWDPESGSYHKESVDLGTSAVSGEFAPDLEAALAVGGGSLAFVDLGGEVPAAETIGALGDTPRRIRCDLESGLCAVSNFGDDTLTLIEWDGETAPTILGSVDVAAGPVGIDVRGNLIVSAGFGDDRYSLVEVGEGDPVVSTEPLPEGCVEPGHAAFVGDGPDAVVVSCNGSDGLAMVPLR